AVDDASAENSAVSPFSFTSEPLLAAILILSASISLIIMSADDELSAKNFMVLILSISISALLVAEVSMFLALMFLMFISAVEELLSFKFSRTVNSPISISPALLAYKVRFCV